MYVRVVWKGSGCWKYLWLIISEIELKVSRQHSSLSNTNTTYTCGDRGGTVVKVLCYKSESRWFDLRWCHWNFSLT